MSEIRSRLWTLTIKDDDDVFQTLGRVSAKDLNNNIETFAIANEIGQLWNIELDDGARSATIGVSGNIHTTGNAAWVVLKQAAFGTDNHDSVISIELDSDDLKIEVNVIPKNLSFSTGFADFIKFNASFVFNSVPVIDDKVAAPITTYTCPVTARVGTSKGTEIKIQDATMVASDAVGAFRTITANSDATWIACGMPGRQDTLAAEGGIIFFTRSGATFTYSSTVFYSSPAASNLYAQSIAMNSAGTRLAAVIARSGFERLVILERTGSTWSEVQTLTNSSQSTGFGRCVTMSGEGDVVAVSSGSGSVAQKIWIFTRDSLGVWSELKTISPTLVDSESTGLHIKLSRNGLYLVAGDLGNDTTAANAGRAWMFYRDEGGSNNWGEQAAIAPPVATSLNFGAAVDLTCDGSYAAVGCPGRTTNMGSVFIYSRTGAVWAQVAEILLDSPNFTGTEFNARAVHFSTDGKLLMIASGQNGSPNTQGLVQWYSTSDFTSWAHIDSWRNSDGANGDRFGEDVWLSESGGYVLLGCPGQDDEGSGSGCLYAYTVYA